MTAVTTVALALALAQSPGHTNPSPEQPPAAQPAPAQPAPQQPAPQQPAPQGGPSQFAPGPGGPLPSPQITPPSEFAEEWLDKAARADLPPITLDEALKAAAANNLDLKAAYARLDQAYQAAWKAWSYYLPQVTAAGTYTRNNLAVSLPFPTAYAVRERTGPAGTVAGEPAEPSSLPGKPTTDLTPNGLFVTPSAVAVVDIQKLNQLGAQIQARQALFAPQLFFTIPNAYKSQHVAELNTEGFRRDVLFAVAQAYYGVASLKQFLEVAERLLEIAQRQENDATVRYKAGTIPKVGLIRAQIDRARAEQDVRRNRNAFLSAKVGLAVLLDRQPDFDVVTPPQPQIDEDPATLVRRAAVERTDVLAAKTTVDISHGSRNEVIASYLPTLGAFGNVTWANITGFTGKETNWAVGLALSWNIFDGGLREADLREANARIVEAEAARDSTLLKAEGQVRQALLDMQSARANAVKAKEQRDLSAENLRLVEVSYRAGAATAVEQADASTQLRNAEIALTTEALNAQLAALSVLRAAGVFEPVPRTAQH
jgi:outer membrane protein TolC